MKLDNFFDFYIFIFFMFLTLTFSLVVFFSRSTILSIFSLIFIFVLVSLNLFILNIKFLGLVYIGTYVGAVLILFLFVIILVDGRVENWLFMQFFNFNTSLLIIFLLLNFLIIIYNLFNYVLLLPVNLNDLNYYCNDSKIEFFYNFIFFNDINIVSFFLYTHYYYYFVFMGLLFLLTMIGSLTLIVNSNLLIIKKIN